MKYKLLIGTLKNESGIYQKGDILELTDAQASNIEVIYLQKIIDEPAKAVIATEESKPVEQEKPVTVEPVKTPVEPTPTPATPEKTVTTTPTKSFSVKKATVNA